MMIFLFKPMSLVEGMLMMIVVLFVFGVIGIASVYFGLKLFAQVINSRRDAWTETARTLGLEMQNQGIIKPLKGVYRNYPVELFHESPDAEHKYTTCKITLPNRLNYDMEITMQNYFSRILDSMVGTNEITVGVDAFDKNFTVNGFDRQGIQKLLTVHLPDGSAPNLIVELLSLKKSAHLVKITDDTVQLQKRGEFLEANDVEPFINSAIHLAEQIQKAQTQSNIS